MPRNLQYVKKGMHLADLTGFFSALIFRVQFQERLSALHLLNAVEILSPVRKIRVFPTLY